MIEEILWDNRSNTELNEESCMDIEKAIKTALSFFDMGNGYQVSVSFVDKDEIHKLNREFRNTDRVTDVLSFPMEEVDPRGVNILGDIVICMEQAECQAEEFGHSVVREVAYLSVHSVLHLLGYDHEREEDKLEMRAMEKQIMKKLGIFKDEKKMDSNVKDELIEIAVKMKDMAYCPYSKHHVGAAILASSGKIYSGCNVENASYGGTICAERTAAVKAVSEGETEFLAVAIACSGPSPAYPCGICRQFLNEFIEHDIPFYMLDGDNNMVEESFASLYPHGFKKKDMNE